MHREMVWCWRVVRVLVFVVGLMCAPAAWGQATRSVSEGAGARVAIDFPADGIELKTLADIVTKRLGIPIVYDETINNKRVVIRVPVAVPESALLGILQSALRMKQLVLVDAEQAGWKQIVPAQNLAALARASGRAGKGGAEPGADGGALTVVISLKNVDSGKVAEALRAFLTQPGGSVQPVAGQKMIIVSDYPAVVEKLERITKMLDSDAPPVEVRFITLKSSEAQAVAALVTQIVANREMYQWGNPAGGVFVAADERSNQVAVIAPPEKMAAVLDLVKNADQPLELATKVYRLKVASPEQIDRLMKDQLGNVGRRMYQGSVDRETRSLVVSATGEIHGRIAGLIKDLDVPATAESSPIRFYKLKNTKSAEVLATISGLVGEGDRSRSGSTGPMGGFSEQTGMNGTGGGLVGVLGTLQGNRINAPTTGPARVNTTNSTDAGGINTVESGSGFVGGGSLVAPSQAYGDQALQGAGSVSAIVGVRTGNATVTADINTNSIIVIAPPAVQQMYAELIKKLDERRPQVQVECTIVTMDTRNDYSYGVDVGTQGGAGKGTIISFGSFGVSNVDPATGGLTPVAASGGTFALLNPSTADVVLRALSNSRKARLVSSPQVLVNDNGKGTLESVNQAPFSEVVTNATVAQQGLGGLAKAGTTIRVEPHISEDDYLQLSYSIVLSNFTGSSSNGLPPPSQSNTVESTVTIPDGYTIVVGGLKVRSADATVQSIPILDQIPILKEILGNHSRTNANTTLFVFIKPTILRDDRFRDLKYISDRAVGKAGVHGNYPVSEPIPIR